MDGECFSFIVAHVAADVFAAACIGECVEQAIARGAVFGGTIDNHGTVARIGLEVGMCIVCTPGLSLVVRNVELSSARASHADQNVAIVPRVWLHRQHPMQAAKTRFSRFLRRRRTHRHNQKNRSFQEPLRQQQP